MQYLPEPTGIAAGQAPVLTLLFSLLMVHQWKGPASGHRGLHILARRILCPRELGVALSAPADRVVMTKPKPGGHQARSRVRQALGANRSQQRHYWRHWLCQSEVLGWKLHQLWP